MPELPEVEARRQLLNSKTKGRKIIEFIAIKRGICKTPRYPAMRKKLIGEIIDRVERVGKYSYFQFSSGKRLLFHFGLFGDMVFTKSSSEEEKSLAGIIRFDNNYDLRFLSWVNLSFREDFPELKRLGPDILSDKFTFQYFYNTIAKLKTNLKTFLQKQEKLAGIGAVYADEICYYAKLLPTKNTKSLSRVEIERLYRSILTTMRGSIEEIKKREYREDRGFLPLYPNVNCPSCGKKITITKIGGRATRFCPNCQK